MKLLTQWKQTAKNLKREICALYIASKRSDVPLIAKVMLFVVVAYALSPIDLIPDFIPVLGYLDDLLLLPLGIYVVLKCIPPGVMAECRAQAQGRVNDPNFKRAGLLLIGSLWVLSILLALKIIL